VWLPLREATSAGIESLVRWFDKEQEGPFQILRKPMLYEADTASDLPTATPIFDTIR
jgi:hypothetical protein